jgi:iron complex outermembrane receptor protein
MQISSSRDVLVRCLSMGVGAATLSVSQFVSAQMANDTSLQTSQDAGGGALQEIVVTARKRSERELDVPASISVVTAQSLDRYAAADLNTVGQQIPQVMFTKNPSGNGANINIRGVGSNTSADDGIEQSVSVNVDGVPTARGRILETGLFDIGQVQVLKGPQALYFGKNSPGGVIVVDSQGPEDKWTGYAKAGYEFTAQNYIGEAAVGGPITDELGFRIAVRGSDMKGGYVHDVAQPIASANDPIAYDHATGLSIPGRAFAWGPQAQQEAVRLTFKWTPLTNLDATFKFFGSEYKDNGDSSQNTVASCPPGSAHLAVTDLSAILFTGAPRVPQDPYSSCGGQRRTNTIGELPPQLLAGLPFNTGSSEFTDNRTYLSSLTANYRVGAVTLTSVSGFYKYSNIGNSFFDGSELALAGGGANSYSTSWNEELRAATSFDFPLNATAGLFYSHDVREYRTWSDIVRFIDPLTGTSVSSAADMQNRGHTLSPFAELTYKILPNLELSGGARYSSERKTGTLLNYYRQPGLVSILNLALPVGTTITGRVHDSNVSPQATLTWHPTDSVSTFVGYRTGFLAGTITNPGLVAASLNDQNVVIRPETVKGYEAGVKFEALGRRLYGDAAIYRYTYDNLQVSAFDSVSNTVLTKNAGGSLVRGVEASLQFRVTDALGVHAAGGFNEAHYTSFNNAGCWGGQTVAQGCVNHEQDLSGQTLPRAPKWSGTLGATWDAPLAGNVLLGVSVDARATSSYNFVATNNPYSIQADYAVFDTSLRLHPSNDRWEGALIVKNLADRFYYLIGSETPLGLSPGSISGVPGEPRTYLLQGTYRF